MTIGEIDNIIDSINLSNIIKIKSLKEYLSLTPEERLQYIAELSSFYLLYTSISQYIDNTEPNININYKYYKYDGAIYEQSSYEYNYMYNETIRERKDGRSGDTLFKVIIFSIQDQKKILIVFDNVPSQDIVEKIIEEISHNNKL